MNDVTRKDNDGRQDDVAQTNLDEALRTLPDNTPDFHKYVYKCNAPWEVMAEGYKKAADIVILHEPDDAWQNVDLLFPLFFLYRHFVELSIKSLMKVARSGIAQNQASLKGHSLLQLMEQFIQCIPNDIAHIVLDANGPRERTAGQALDVLRCWSTTFDKTDPYFDRYRYPESNKGTEYPYPSLFDLFCVPTGRELMEAMSYLDECVQDLRRAISAHLDLKFPGNFDTYLDLMP